MIASIQSGTRDAVASMSQGVSRVAEGVALATQAGESINEIGGNARQVVEKVADISHALREQSVASTEIASHVEQVARMAEENCAAVAGNAATAARIFGFMSSSLDPSSSDPSWSAARAQAAAPVHRRNRHRHTRPATPSKEPLRTTRRIACITSIGSRTSRPIAAPGR